MEIEYRGFKIIVNREKAMGGWSSIYYSIVRISDEWFMDDGFSVEDSTPLKDFADGLKTRVNEYYEHPELYEEDYGLGYMQGRGAS